MVDIISYIKSLVFPTERLSRKRRASDDYELPQLKMRKTRNSPYSSSSDDDWYSPSSSAILGNLGPRTGLRSSNCKLNWSKENPPVIIDDDDDDDIAEVIKPKYEPVNLNKSFGKLHSTSTPRRASLLNGKGNDDVTYLGSTQTLGQRKLDAKKQYLEYLKPFSYLEDKPKKDPLKNGNKFKDFSIPILKRVWEVRNKLGLNKRRQLRSAVMDQSYRLDEKMKYQELLAQATANSKLAESFSKYSSPTGKLFAYGTTTRGKKMVEMAGGNKTKTIECIDLTGHENHYATRSKTLSTKDTILKVLDKYDNEAVVIKDSDSDLEILPNPPSPKPDIKVPRVNSFKTIVDSAEHTHEEWLRSLIQRHRKVVTNYEREINAKASHTEKLNEITSEIHSQRLGDKLAKYLQIKDAVLPVSFSEEVSFPPLTDDDDARIDIALNKRANHNEVLSFKFNLKISRLDILTLSGLNWLNDEVINFYMNLIIERGKLSQWPKTYAMNTFFYPKLVKDGHSSLKRWTRRIDIFSFDLIAVPIHLGVHWCMSVIDLKNKKITYYDSMGSPNNQCLNALSVYLEEEHLDKKKTDFDSSDWHLENAKKIPHQMNGSDCGMFACTFAEVLTRRAKISFSQEDMPYLRRKMVLEILNGELMIQ